jgi:hypothetical protein
MFACATLPVVIRWDDNEQCWIDISDEQAIEDGEDFAPGWDVDELHRWMPLPEPPKTKPSEVEARLREVQPDALTPREALQLIYDLRDAALAAQKPSGPRG